MTTPMAIASDQAIWQTKVAPDVQGRVFAVQQMVRTVVMPLGFLVAGPLADQVFGPAMMPGGNLAATFGWLVGVGPGAGIDLMFVGTSVMGMTISLSGYLFRWVRNVERDRCWGCWRVEPRSCCCACTAMRSGYRSAMIGPGMCSKPRSLVRQGLRLRFGRSRCMVPNAGWVGQEARNQGC